MQHVRKRKLFDMFYVNADTAENGITNKRLLSIRHRYKPIRSTKRGGNQSSAMKFDIGRVNAYNDNPQGIFELERYT